MFFYRAVTSGFLASAAFACSTSDVPESVGDEGNPQESTVEFGELCVEDEDCKGGKCLYYAPGDLDGLCTDTCFDWPECPDAQPNPDRFGDWECCPVSNSGSRMCMPADWDISDCDRRCKENLTRPCICNNDYNDEGLSTCVDGDWALCEC